MAQKSQAATKMQCPPLFGSSVRASKSILAINVRTSKPISNHVSVSNVRPREPSSSSHARSSKLLVLATFVQVKPAVLVMFVQVNLFVLCPSK